MKALRWFVFNAFFASCLYFGAINDSFVYTVGLLIAWLAIVSSIYAFFDKEMLNQFSEKGGFSVPFVVDIAFDALTIYLLFTTGAIFTMLWYFVSILFSAAIRIKLRGMAQ